MWEQARAGQAIEVWTVCAGLPAQGEAISAFAEQLHRRWQTGEAAVAARRAEDERALQLLGVVPRFWHLPDCIYRRLPEGVNGAPGGWLVNSEEDLWQPVHPGEAGLVAELSAWIAQGLHPADALVSPLALGNHVDHNLVRAAAEAAAVERGCRLLYYPDYPYAVRGGWQVSDRTGPGWRAVCREVSPEALRAWQEAIACYSSQISTFWSGRAGMEADIENYWREGGGSCLYQPPDGEAVNSL